MCGQLFIAPHWPTCPQLAARHEPPRQRLKIEPLHTTEQKGKSRFFYISLHCFPLLSGLLPQNRGFPSRLRRSALYCTQALEGRHHGDPAWRGARSNTASLLIPLSLAMLTGNSFSDLHYYYGPPTAKPPHHRFDKGSYVYLFENASHRRARIEIANNPGTADQDAFNGCKLHRLDL